MWTDKRSTDVSYLACAAFLLNSSWLRGPAFATHNTRTVADILAMTGGMDDFVEAGCEFQRLHGMGVGPPPGPRSRYPNQHKMTCRNWNPPRFC